MRYEFKKTFDKSSKRFSKDEWQVIKKVVFDTIDFLASGKPPSQGYGLKHLRWDLWEVRVNIKYRIIFKFTDDLVQFIIVGNHEDILRFLKRY